MRARKLVRVSLKKKDNGLASAAWKVDLRFSSLRHVFPFAADYVTLRK